MEQPPAAPAAPSSAPPGPQLTGAPVERLDLGRGSWVDVSRGWLRGADELHDVLVERVAWQQGRIFRYDRWIDEPRLNGWWAPGRPLPHPAIVELHRGVRRLCGVPFEGVAFARYRDGRDSVAFHRDREMRYLDDTVIAVLTLGARRPFLLRPRTNRHRHDAPAGGALHDLAPASGDLLVMGGRCQADWEHAVPKAAMLAAGRISLQWRWTARTGRPVQGASYRAPRTYSRR